MSGLDRACTPVRYARRIRYEVRHWHIEKLLRASGMLAIAVVASLVVVVHGHGAVVNPPYAMQLAYNAPPAVPTTRRQCAGVRSLSRQTAPLTACALPGDLFCRPRNAVDRDLKPWSGAVPAQPPNVESDTGWCQVPGEDGKPSGRNGQACFCTHLTLLWLPC